MLDSLTDWKDACEEWQTSTESGAVTLPDLLLCQNGCTHESSWVCKAVPSPDPDPVCLCLHHED